MSAFSALRFCRGLTGFFRFGFRCLLLRQRCLLFGDRRLARPVRILLGLGCFRRGLHGLFLHAFGFRLGLLGLHPGLLGFLAAIGLFFRVGASLRGAFLGGSPVRFRLRLGVLIGLLLYGNYASLFGGLHRVTRHGDDNFFVALAPVGFLRLLQLLIGFRDRGGRVLSGIRIFRNAHRIARLE